MAIQGSYTHEQTQGSTMSRKQPNPPPPSQTKPPPPPPPPPARKPDISVKDAKRLRVEMQSRIRKELDAFTDATGVFVENLVLTTEKGYDRWGFPEVAFYHVVVEVSI